jgi:hypothetical protein
MPTNLCGPHASYSFSPSSSPPLPSPFSLLHLPDGRRLLSCLGVGNSYSLCPLPSPHPPATAGPTWLAAVGLSQHGLPPSGPPHPLLRSLPTPAGKRTQTRPPPQRADVFHASGRSSSTAGRAGGSPLRRVEQAGSGISGEPPMAELPPCATACVEAVAAALLTPWCRCTARDSDARGGQPEARHDAFCRSGVEVGRRRCTTRPPPLCPTIAAESRPNRRRICRIHGQIDPAATRFGSISTCSSSSSHVEALGGGPWQRRFPPVHGGFSQSPCLFSVCASSAFSLSPPRGSPTFGSPPARRCPRGPRPQLLQLRARSRCS